MAGRTATNPSSFLLTLPSNASSNAYPLNNPSDFTVNLNPPLELTGNYECSLVEISLPRSWANVADSNDLSVHLKNVNTKQTQKIHLSSGHYGTIPYLLSKFNTQVKPEFRKFASPDPNTIGTTDFYYRDLLFWRKDLQKIHLSVPKDVKIVFSPTLQNILGLSHKRYEGPLHTYADNVSNIHSNIGAFYVYGSIIENRHVGDTKAPLLRIVPIDGDDNSCDIFHSFTNLQFNPVRLTHFDRITIHIRDGQGKLIPFQRGIVVLTLQFRRRLF